MSEAMILLLAQLALKYGPVVGQAWHAIFTTANPTPAQWDAVWTKDSYDAYVPPANAGAGS